MKIHQEIDGKLVSGGTRIAHQGFCNCCGWVGAHHYGNRAFEDAHTEYVQHRDNCLLTRYSGLDWLP